MREHNNAWLLILVAAMVVVFPVVFALTILAWRPMYSIVIGLAVAAAVGSMILTTYLVVRSRRKDDQP